MKPRRIPTAWFRTAATGTRQLVVQDAFEITLCDLRSLLLLTPWQTVMSALLQGAETSTFFAPPTRWAEAASLLAKRPVHSITISTPRSLQGSFVGSRSDRPATLRPSTWRALFIACTLPG